MGHNPVVYAKWHRKAEKLCMYLYVIACCISVEMYYSTEEANRSLTLNDNLMTCLFAYFGMFAVVNLISYGYRSTWMDGAFKNYEVINHIAKYPDEEANGMARELAVMSVGKRSKVTKDWYGYSRFDWIVKVSFVFGVQFLLLFVFVY